MAEIEILKQAEADLQAAREELTAAQEQVRVAQEREQSARARTQEMQAVWDWLQRHSKPEVEAPAAPATPTAPVAPGPTKPTDVTAQLLFGKPMPEVTHAEMCLRVLQSLGRKASTKEIRERLARDGHELSQEQIRGSLKYLSRKTPPLVETTTGTGVWRLKNAAPGASAASTNEFAMNGAGRG